MAQSVVERPRVIRQLHDRGYYVFERALPPEFCDRLLTFALTQTSTTRVMEGGGYGEPRSVVYDRVAPKAVRYDFDTSDLLANQDVQKLLADLSFASLAQDYLGSKPVIDVVAMWWHTAFSDRPDSQAAQFFHFDLDRPKWLKFFIYLTDVTPENGPHSFVAGSHRTGAIPDNLLKKGYARLTDEEVYAAFDERDLVEFSAPRGTIIAEDTRGLHKGRHVERGDRLMLQIQFSNSLFGSEYAKARIGTVTAPALESRLAEYPGLYTAYV